MIDSHCHLAGREFDPDLPEVVCRARAAGVTGALCILADDDAAEDEGAARVRDQWPEVRFAAGIHPHNAGRHAGDVAGGVAAVEARLRRHGAVALGEIGLDYHYDLSPRDVQQEVFRSQIALARRLHLPVIIHTREATADTLAILRADGAGELTGVFHCFTGDDETAAAAVELGFYLSFAGIVTFAKADALRETARRTPADRLLVETDAPYLAPAPFRGKRNEPAYVAKVVERIAAVRGVATDELARQTAGNFQRLFAAGVG
jgi:TatD DNase family protein